MPLTVSPDDPHQELPLAQARRPQLAIDRFRIAVGLALLLHCARHLSETVPILATGRLFDPVLLRSAMVVRVPFLAEGTSVQSLQLFFAFGAGLALAIILGLAPRFCALGLFGLLAVTHWAILPIASIDDYTASLFTGFLVLLPIGKTLSILPRQKTELEAYCPNRAAISVVLLQVSAIYLSGRLGVLCGAPPSSNHTIAVALQSVPVLFLLPGTAFQVLGTALQFGVHAYLASTTQAIVSNSLLVSTCFLFLRGMTRGANQYSKLDAGGTLAVSYLVLVALTLTGWMLGANSITGRTGRLLADLALFPEMSSFPARELRGSLVIAATSADPDIGGSTHRWVLPSSRGDLIMSRLAGPPSDPLRSALAGGLAVQYCREQGSPGWTVNFIAEARQHAGSEARARSQSHTLLAAVDCGEQGKVLNIR